MNIKALFQIPLWLLISFMAMSQNHVIPLYQNNIPNSKSSNVKEHSEITDAHRISHVIEPSIEVYLPSRAHSTGKAVVICPGGGYRILAWDKEGTDVAKWLNGQGIAGIVLKYRLPDDDSNVDPYKSPLMDAQQAMELTRLNAGEWNINPDQIGIMGFSAGGHLASTLGTNYTIKSKPNFMILIYPVITMKDDFTHQGSKLNLLGNQPSQELINRFSGELNVTKDTPPTFIVHSEDDGAVPIENSIQFYLALRKHNVPAEFHAYPMGGHGYGLAIKKGRLAEWPGLLASWLKAQ